MGRPGTWLRNSLLAATAFAGGTAAAVAGPAPIGDFTLGDLVVSAVTGSTLDSASPITLNEFSIGAGGGSASLVGALTLPQSPSFNVPDDTVANMSDHAPKLNDSAVQQLQLDYEGRSGSLLAPAGLHWAVNGLSVLGSAAVWAWGTP